MNAMNPKPKCRVPRSVVIQRACRNIHPALLAHWKRTGVNPATVPAVKSIVAKMNR